MHWLTLTWWKYLFERRSKYSDVSIIKTAICRARNHPAGVWWYNPSGLEPDMHCKNCGDDLG
jgi:hypothetical protein